LLTALGVGLLIGLMRERRSGDPDSGPSAAGLRTHALAALGAALAWHLGPNVFLVTLAISGLLVTVSYRRSAEKDIGLTGEFALLVTVLLGALAMISVGMSAAMGVVCALLLHLRSQLHHLGRELISEQEVHDGLVLAASALVVLPLLPDEPIDPWGVIVPASLWNLVVLVMAAGVAGQVALRLVGARFGLPVAGFFTGFASSTAATVGYGQRVADEAKLLPYAASAALFANLASLLLLVAVLSTINTELLAAATWPLAAACLGLLASASAGLLHGGGRGADAQLATHSKSFKLSHALALVAFVAFLLVLSAVLSSWVGERGALAVAVIGGMAELHGAALTIGQLARGGQIPLEHASWGIVFLLFSSSLVKSVLAFGSGGRAYGIRVCGGLAVMVTAAVLATWFMPGQVNA
jgi:uncharacterized membrane protein (DUF4010 family)